MARIAAATAWCCVPWFLTRPFLRPWPAARARWRRRRFGAWGRSVVKILNIDVEVEGSPPDPPFLMVSNHLSYIDIPILCSRLDTIFVSKSDVADWPVIGFLVRHMDTIFVDRNLRRDIPRVVARLDQALDAGEGVVVFPEGTSSAGADVRPFLPSLLEPAVRQSRGVSTVALSYSTGSGDPPAHLGVCWWGDMTFTDHFFRMLAIPGFSARLAFGREPIDGVDRKELAERLHAEVTRLFVPVEGAAE